VPPGSEHLENAMSFLNSFKAVMSPSLSKLSDYLNDNNRKLIRKSNSTGVSHILQSQLIDQQHSLQ
jgi:hypothetical protein